MLSTKEMAGCVTSVKESNCHSLDFVEKYQEYEESQTHHPYKHPEGSHETLDNCYRDLFDSLEAKGHK